MSSKYLSKGKTIKQALNLTQNRIKGNSRMIRKITIDLAVTLFTQFPRRFLKDIQFEDLVWLVEYHIASFDTSHRIPYLAYLTQLLRFLPPLNKQDSLLRGERWLNEHREWFDRNELDGRHDNVYLPDETKESLLSVDPELVVPRPEASLEIQALSNTLFIPR